MTDRPIAKMLTRCLLPLIFLTLPACAKIHATGSQTHTTYFVKSCVDGDTCRLVGPDHIELRVRLAGIDAPEIAHKKRQLAQPFGNESKQFINQLVVGKRVWIKNYGEDLYHRQLEEIFFNDANINLLMVQKGMAEVYQGRPPQGFDMAAYQVAQFEAQRAKLGIWSQRGVYESPKQWRKEHK